MFCLGLCGLFLAFMPYFWIPLMPLLATCCGEHFVLRLSILVLIQTGVSSLLFTNLVIEPLIQIGLLVGLFSLPVSVTPSLLVWSYNMLLWVSEPVWVALEAIGVVRISTLISRKLIDRIDDQPFLAKSAIISISVVCYFTAADLCWVIFSSGKFILHSMLLLVLLLSVFTHILMYHSGSGVLSDVAAVSMWSILLVYSVLDDNKLNNTLDKNDYQKANQIELDKDISFLRLLITIAVQAVSYAGLLWDFGCMMFHPWSLACVFLRLNTVIWTINVLKKWFSEEDDDDDDDIHLEVDDEDSLLTSMASWQSPLTVRLSIIFVYTQFVCNFLVHTDSTLLLRVMPVNLLHTISKPVFIQILFLYGTYIYYLYQGIEAD